MGEHLHGLIISPIVAQIDRNCQAVLAYPFVHLLGQSLMRQIKKLSNRLDIQFPLYNRNGDEWLKLPKDSFDHPRDSLETTL